MNEAERFLVEHRDVSRRFFLGCGIAGAAAHLNAGRVAADHPPELARVLETLEPYFTAQDDFRDVSRGTPLPHRCPRRRRRRSA